MFLLRYTLRSISYRMRYFFHMRGMPRFSMKRLLELFVALCCALQIAVFVRNREDFSAEEEDDDLKYVSEKPEVQWYVNDTIEREILKQFQSPVHKSLLPYDYWRYVLKDEFKGSVLVYSAYYDDVTMPKVRLIAVAPRRKIPSLKCVLLGEDGNITKTTIVKMTPIKEGWPLKYAAHFIDCPLPDSAIPSAVSVIRENDTSAKHKVEVQVAPENSTVGDFVVCIKPLHYEFNRALWLVEFIEFYRILGVQHFVFYNHTVGADVERVLNYYIRKELASVFPWMMPMVTQKEVRTENMFAALNDCVYRSRHRYKYAVMVDMDEFIVPNHQYNYTQLMQFLLQDEVKSNPYGSFVFKNVFHYLYWDNDTAAVEKLKEYEKPGEGGQYILTQLKTQRLREPHAHLKRSKYITRPELTVEAGNHNVWIHTSNVRPMNVPATVGLSRHYRICEFGGWDCLKLPSMIDKSLHRYADELLPNIFSECKKMFGKVGCPKAPPLGSPY